MLLLLGSINNTIILYNINTDVHRSILVYKHDQDKIMELDSHKVLLL